MTCSSCSFLGDQCGGQEGDPALPTLDPRSMTKEQLVSIACALARVGTLLCEIGQGSVVGASPASEEPYIWDQKEL